MEQELNMIWQDKLIACTDGTQLGAIACCVLDRNIEGGVQQFHGKAIATSDGYLMCDFTDRDGNYHIGAFVGSVRDFQRNVIGVADHLKLSDAERNEWYAAANSWITR